MSRNYFVFKGPNDVELARSASQCERGAAEKKEFKLTLNLRLFFCEVKAIWICDLLVKTLFRQFDEQKDPTFFKWANPASFFVYFRSFLTLRGQI